MKLLIFSVKDSAAEYYQDPVYARTRAEILRSLMLALRDPKSPFAVHAEHFSLFEIGAFHPLTCELVPHASPVLVANLWDLPRGES